jgi:hypothetical protein
MKKRNWIHIAIAVVLGYLTALAIRYAKPSLYTKVTFVGLMANFVSQNELLKIYWAGVTGYQLAEEAGLSPYKADKELGKIIAPNKYEEFEYRENFFKVQLSKWSPVYVEKNGKWKPNFWNILENPYKENGVYFIRDANKEVVYVGLVSESKDGFHRLLRHFAEDNPKIKNKVLNHNTYPYYGGYEFRIAQLQNTNNDYRRKLLEEYYQFKFKPRDSFTAKMQYQIAFADNQESRIVNSILNNNEELAEKYAGLERTKDEPTF